MPKIYKRNCDNCGKPYEGRGKFYCQQKCQPVWNKGKKLTQKHKDKIKKNNARYWLGTHHNVGYKHTEEWKQKMSINFSGEKSPSWQGGKSFEIYPIDWTKTLRISIRERDRYTCQICSDKQGDTVFHIHHIDYDKRNCNPNNLITLCKSCHMKTNFGREYWIEYFEDIKK
jgi:hypothetical protein